jgi:D-aminoacyl-tRNA deacylase
MKFKILASKNDTAGRNIAAELEKLGLGAKIVHLETDSIHAENIDKQIFGDIFIFVSKHKSEQKNKTLTVHAPGNWRPQKSIQEEISDGCQNSKGILKQADLGGQPGKVCPTASFFLKHLFLILNEKAKNSEYKVSMEVTHHGPYMERPCCFIEIGSGEEQWQDKNAAKIIAEAVKQAISTDIGVGWISAIGIGGPHYCPNFNKVQLSSNYALGHIIPEYSLPLTKEMLKEAIEKTLPQPELAILDWKGLGKAESRQEILKLLEQAGLKYIRTDKAKS